jgi:hypothetical protein
MEPPTMPITISIDDLLPVLLSCRLGCCSAGGGATVGSGLNPARFSSVCIQLEYFQAIQDCISISRFQFHVRV